MGLSGVLTALIPVCASISFWSLFAVRMLIGVLAVSAHSFWGLADCHSFSISVDQQGVLYPALHNLISKWAPPVERGKFISSLLGGTFGTVITWPMSGILIENLGWVWAFYVPAVATIFITIVWYTIVYDSPTEHPRISTAEREYIEKSLGDNISKKKVPFQFNAIQFIFGGIYRIYSFVFSVALGDATSSKFDDITAIHCARIVALW